MGRRKQLSGKKCVQILCTNFGFEKRRQRGSHVVLRKGNIVTVVPLHPQLKRGTLKGVLKLAQIDEEIFSQYL